MGFRGIATRRRFGLVIAVTAGALFCAGCNSTDPIVTESPSVTAVPVTSSPGASSPGATATAAPLSSEDLLAMMPAGAGQPDVQGAVVTAQYFVELLGTIYASGDASAWTALSTPACSYCVHKSEEVDDLVASDWTAQGGDVLVTATGIRGAQADDGFTYVKVPAEIADLYLVDSDGKRSLAEAASSVELGLQMELIDGMWRVNGVTIEDL